MRCLDTTYPTMMHSIQQLDCSIAASISMAESTPVLPQMARGIQKSSNPSNIWISKLLAAETINVSSPAAPVKA
jgi:hypothetical protein